VGDPWVFLPIEGDDVVDVSRPGEILFVAAAVRLAEPLVGEVQLHEHLFQHDRTRAVAEVRDELTVGVAHVVQVARDEVGAGIGRRALLQSFAQLVRAFLELGDFVLVLLRHDAKHAVCCRGGRIVAARVDEGSVGHEVRAGVILERVPIQPQARCEGPAVGLSVERLGDEVEYVST